MPTLSEEEKMSNTLFIYEEQHTVILYSNERWCIAAGSPSINHSIKYIRQKYALTMLQICDK